jgi:TPR repeat protein
MTSLATFYRDGVGVEKDEKLAAHWSSRAANASDQLAKDHFGSLSLDDNSAMAMAFAILTGEQEKK